MTEQEILHKLHEALLSAKNSFEAAEKWVAVLAEEKNLELDKVKVRAKEKVISANEENIIEGVFDGQNMIDDKNDVYPVPANYASKSKLVEGDRLKLTIQADGSFLYKQIELIPRKLLVGKLILDGNQYQVLTEKKAYNVLYASVTFFKCKVGDKITIIVPEDELSTWAAVENVIHEKEV